MTLCRVPALVHLDIVRSAIRFAKNHSPQCRRSLPSVNSNVHSGRIQGGFLFSTSFICRSVCVAGCISLSASFLWRPGFALWVAMQVVSGLAVQVPYIVEPGHRECHASRCPKLHFRAFFSQPIQQSGSY